MKKHIALTVLALVIMNIGIFMHGIALSDDINRFEKEITALKKENRQLEQSMYSLESITQTASLAAELNFDTYHDPLYIEKPQYALK